MDQLFSTLLSLIIFCSQITGAAVQPFLYSSLPTGSITPTGWLETQLEIQADGLTGHLSHFWAGVNQSAWIVEGGTGDNALAEWTPYWLNGIIPLHFLLPDRQDLSEQSWQYISYILEHQTSEGWLGPDRPALGGNQYWGRWNVLNAFQMYVEGNSTMDQPLKKSLLNYMLEQEKRMESTAFGETWSGARFMDFILAVMWLLDNGGDVIKGYETNLNHLIDLSVEQGFDWENWFEHQLPTSAVTRGLTLYTHGVNNAQAFKSAAVLYRCDSSNETLRDLSASRLLRMDEYHGQATGMFGCDEHLAGRMPSRGTELCTVVEYMWSFQIMFRVFGDVRYLDRLERVAMNAMPATFGSPQGGDMWAHQYLQQNNEINAMRTEPHVWEADGPDSTVYGLEPNYGCCTANFNQGWPKYASGIFYTSNEGVIIGIYAPSSTNGVINGMASIEITTKYPFGDEIVIDVDAVKDFDLFLRIPHWAPEDKVQLTVDNTTIVGPGIILNGTLHKVSLSKGKHVLNLNFNPTVRLYKGGSNGGVALLRGSLLFSLPIDPEWQIKKEYEFESRDYWCSPQSKWNYALDIKDLENIEQSVEVKNAEWIKDHAPFNRTNIPIMLEVNAHEVYGWKVVTNAAGPPPKSPTCAQATNCNSVAEKLVLVPYGTTDLRISEFPLAFTSF